MPELQNDFKDYLGKLISENQIQQFKTDLQNQIVTNVKNECTTLIESIVDVKIEKLLKNIQESLKTFTHDNQQRLLLTHEVCTRFGICRSTLYNYEKYKPNFPNPKRIGKKKYYNLNELNDFLNRIKQYKREPP